MANIPEDLHYSKDHEWVRVSDRTAQVGITDYAQKQLGDVVYLELPDVGRSFTKGDVFGTIESVKSVSTTSTIRPIWTRSTPHSPGSRNW